MVWAIVIIYSIPGVYDIMRALKQNLEKREYLLANSIRDVSDKLVSNDNAAFDLAAASKATTATMERSYAAAQIARHAAEVAMLKHQAAASSIFQTKKRLKAIEAGKAAKAKAVLAKETSHSKSIEKSKLKHELEINSLKRNHHKEHMRAIKELKGLHAQLIKDKDQEHAERIADKDQEHAETLAIKDRVFSAAMEGRESEHAAAVDSATKATANIEAEHKEGMRKKAEEHNAKMQAHAEEAAAMQKKAEESALQVALNLQKMFLMKKSLDAKDKAYAAALDAWSSSRLQCERAAVAVAGAARAAAAQTEPARTLQRIYRGSSGRKLARKKKLVKMNETGEMLAMRGTVQVVVVGRNKLEIPLIRVLGRLQE